MHDWMIERENKLRKFFALDAQTEIISPGATKAFDVSLLVSEHLKKFNLEWHIVPSADAVQIDTEDYRSRLYPTFKIDSNNRDYQKTSSYRAITKGHERHQGKIIAVETTLKPRYLPNNRQFYGTQYGFDSGKDPFSAYFGAARIMSGTRYAHNYNTLRQFVNLVNKDWNERGLMPPGFRLTICPPVVFNLIGNIFHSEWSATESLELGFYRDESGNAKCYAVGSNAPGDFSYINEVEVEADWTLLGFRTALVPE